MKIGVMFGSPETTTGGNALKFYSSIRLDIRRIASLKQADEVIGNRARVKVVKNKMAAPFREAEFDIMFGKGISKAGEIIDLGVTKNVIQKSGSWFSYGDQRLGQGRESVKEFINNDPALMEKIELDLKKACAVPKDEEKKSAADERSGASSQQATSTKKASSPAKSSSTKGAAATK